MNTQIKINRQFLNDIREIIDKGKAAASTAVAHTAILTYWHIGKRIVEEEQAGYSRAQYGKRIIPALAEELKLRYGSGYGQRNLAYYRKFYLAFPDKEILHTCVQNLSWSHIRLLVHVEDKDARQWYLQEATEEMWSVRTLERNITTQYYGRRLAAQRENLSLPAPDIVAKYEPEEYIKNPLVAEFLGFRRNGDYTESELEQALIDNLQQFIMELGRGFAFVDRQKHIRTDLGISMPT
ncbi:MAG: PDDEXK nuclease domain-containing protein [Alistipes indistinctus]